MFDDTFAPKTWAQGGHEERGGCVVKEGKQNGEVGGGRSEGEEKRFVGRGQCKRGGGSRSSCGRSKGSSCGQHEAKYERAMARTVH